MHDFRFPIYIEFMIIQLTDIDDKQQKLQLLKVIV